VGGQSGRTIYQGGALSAGGAKASGNVTRKRRQPACGAKDVKCGKRCLIAGLASARAQIEHPAAGSAAQIAFDGYSEEAKGFGARTTRCADALSNPWLDARFCPRFGAVTALCCRPISVLAATGQLTRRTLKLPVQIYDPSAYYNLVKDGPNETLERG